MLLFFLQGNSSLQTSYEVVGHGRSNPVQVLQTSHEDPDVKVLLHPAIDNQFKAIYTARDHNCLWNSICLCLGLPEEEQMQFRNLTVSTILENEAHFKNLLKCDGNNETFESVINACLQPNQYDGWGNEYHLLALAIALNRNIYVYGSFRNNTGRFLQNARTDISKLAKMFQGKVEGTLQHRNYQPTKGIDSRSPLCLFFHKRHYTALVPRISNPIHCIPHYVVVQSIDYPTQNVASCEILSQEPLNQGNLQETSDNKKSQSRYSKWYHSLSKEQKRAYNKKRADNRNAERTSTQNRKYYEANTNSLQDKARQRKRKLYADSSKREQINAKNKQWFEDPVRKEINKARSSKRQREIYDHPEGREKLKAEKKKRFDDPVQNEINKARSKKRFEDPKVKEMNKARSSKRQREMYADPVGKEKLKAEKKKRFDDPVQKEINKARSNKRFEDPALKEINKARSSKRQGEIYADPTGKEKLKAEKKKRFDDPVQKEINKARSKKRFNDPALKEINKARSSKRQHEIYSNPEEKEKVKAKNRKRKYDVYADPVERENLKAESRKRQKAEREKKKEKSKNISHLIQEAKIAMQEFPALACSVCHRARFREQVIHCQRAKYPNKTEIQHAMTGDYVHQCDDQCKDRSKYHDLKKKE